jgi:hypothetical protein
MVAYHFTHSIGDLAADCESIAARGPVELPKVVRANVERGNTVAQGFARRASGPHGSSYWKRLTWEVTGPLTGEYGPHGGGVPVGGGWRHGLGNSDLARSTDVIGPAFAAAVGDTVQGWFWP